MSAPTPTMLSLELRVKVKVIAMIYDKVLSYLSPFTSVFPSYYSSSSSLHSSHSGFLVFILQKSPALSLCTHSLPAPQLSSLRHPSGSPLYFSPSSYWRINLASHLQLLYAWHHFLSHFLALSFFIAFITAVHLIYCLPNPPLKYTLWSGNLCLFHSSYFTSWTLKTIPGV